MTSPTALYKLDVICGACGTGHLNMPVAPGKSPGKCRKCGAALAKDDPTTEGE